MSRPILATISPAALAHNLAVVRRHVGATKIWAVVKANAYGHGLERIYPGLAEADGLALLDLAEAEQLRALGWRKPILLLEGFFDASDLARIAALQLTPVMHAEFQIEMLEQAEAQGQPLPPLTVYLKLNSGMNRLGFQIQAYRLAYARLRHLRCVRRIGLMSHFANADVVNTDVVSTDGAAASTSVEIQVACFEAANQSFDAGFDAQVECSLANSAAILMHPATHLDWVRPGIMLYGATPFDAAPERSAAAFGLQAVMTLSSRIIAVQTIDAGATVGYGSQFVAEHAMRIGIVACGYADGYPRLAPNGTPVLVNGQRTNTVGRVSMDMLTVDLTALPDTDVGSPVELWGEELPVDEVAQAAGTVGYELLCALSPRVPVQTVD